MIEVRSKKYGSSWWVTPICGREFCRTKNEFSVVVSCRKICWDCWSWLGEGVQSSTVDSAYRGHCLPWTTLNRGQSAMHPAFWGKNSAYRGQLSQLWTVDTISWHQGALSLLTMDSQWNFFFLFCGFFFVVFFCFIFNSNLQFCEIIFLGFPFDVYSLLSKVNWTLDQIHLSLNTITYKYSWTKYPWLQRPRSRLFTEETTFTFKTFWPSSLIFMTLLKVDTLSTVDKMPCTHGCPR